MPENMCFTDTEKRDLINKVNQHDADLSNIRTTIRVSVTCASVFMGIIISGASWYLSDKLEQLDPLLMSDRETTVVVDRLVEDVRELTIQVRNIIQRLGSLQQ